MAGFNGFSGGLSGFGGFNQQQVKQNTGGGGLFGIPMPNLGLGNALSMLGHMVTGGVGLGVDAVRALAGNPQPLIHELPGLASGLGGGLLGLSKDIVQPAAFLPGLASQALGGPNIENALNSAYNTAGQAIGAGNIETPIEAALNQHGPGLLPTFAGQVSAGATVAGGLAGALGGVGEGAAAAEAGGEPAAAASLSGKLGQAAGKLVSPETGEAAARAGEQLEPLAHPYQSLKNTGGAAIRASLGRFADEAIARDQAATPTTFQPGEEAVTHAPDGTQQTVTVIGDAGSRDGVPHYFTDLSPTEPVPGDTLSHPADTATPQPTEWRITESLQNSASPVAQALGKVTAAARAGEVRVMSGASGVAQRSAATNEVFKQKALARFRTMAAISKPDMKAAQAATDVIVKEHGIDPQSALQMTGRLIRQKADATGVLEGELRGRLPDVVVNNVRGHELDVPKEVREDPKVQAAVDEAVSYYRDVREPENVQRMMESRLGDKGLEYRESDEPQWTAAQKRASALIDKLRAQIGRLDESRIPAERGRVESKLETIQAASDRIDRQLKGVRDARTAVEGKIAGDRQAIWDREAQGVAATEDAQATRELSGKELKAHKRTRQLEESAKEWDRTYTAAREEALKGGQYRYRFDPDQDPAIAVIKSAADNAVEKWADAYQDEFNAFRQRRDAERGATPKPKPEGVKSAYARGLRSGKRGELAAREADLIRRKKVVQRSLDATQKVLDEHLTESEQLRASLEKNAGRGEAALAKARANPPLETTPARWQPLYDAVKELHGTALKYPEMASVLADLPKSLPEVINWAHAKGIDPVYVAEMRPDQVSRLLYDSDAMAGTDLGKETSASTRRLRSGAARRAGLVDDTPAGALAASELAAIREESLNQIVSYLEQNITRPTPQGDRAGEFKVPRGMRAWDEHKYAFINAHHAPQDRVTPTLGAERMIPKSVANFMHEFSQTYSHWIFRAGNKALGGISALLIRWNPAFYLHHFIRLMTQAMVGGARPGDFARSWHAIRNGEVPELAHQYLTLDRNTGMLDAEYRTGRSVIRDRFNETHNPIAATHAGAARLMGNIDQWARTAVYLEKISREGLGHDDALLAANDALTDYNRLSPMEQKLARNAVLFYAIRKGIFKIIAKMPFDHPLAYSLLVGLNNIGLQKQKDDYGIDLPGAYAGLANVFGANLNLTSYNPFRDAEGLTTPQGIIQALNPGLQDVIAEGTGYGVTHPTSYAMTDTGQLIPQEGLLNELGDTILRTPDFNLINGLSGNTTKSPLEALGSFVGAPVMSKQAVQNVVTRTAENTAKQTEGPQPFGTTVKSITNAAQPVMQQSGTLNADALQAAFGSGSIADLVKQRNTALDQAQGTATKFGGKGTGFSSKTKKSSGGRRRAGISKARIHKASAKRSGGHIKAGKRASVKRATTRKSSGSIRLPRLHVKMTRGKKATSHGL